jgi:hypothetical protein
MTQPSLDLDPSLPAPAPAAAEPAADPVAAAGFEVGFEHARYGLVPLPGLLLDGTPIGQGWHAGRAVFGRRPRAGTPAVRQWLELRTEAWRSGVAFEPLQLTPHFLARIRVERCPVLRVSLGGGRDHPAAAWVERLNPRAGYAAGNVAWMSRAAAAAARGVDHAEAVHRARQAAGGTGSDIDPDAGAWWRVAALRSYATRLPFAEAAALPLAVLPPSRVRLLNAVQGLQALLTLQFATPGCGERMCALGDQLRTSELRQDFALWVGALMPRAVEAQAQPQQRASGLALEDAWLVERVLRRWHQFALALGEAGVAQLLAHALALPLPGRVALEHGEGQAVDGWSLASDGRLSGAGAPRQPGPDSARHGTVQLPNRPQTPPSPPPPPPAAALPAIRRRTGRPPVHPAPRATAGPLRAAR